MALQPCPSLLLSAALLLGCISPRPLPPPDSCTCVDTGDDPAVSGPVSSHAIPCVGCVNVITGPQQLDHILAMTDGPLIVSFTLESCEPCIVFQPLLEDFAMRRAGDAVVVQVDVERHPALLRQHGIESVPALVLFDGGKVIDSAVGLQSCQRLDEFLGRR